MKNINQLLEECVTRIDKKTRFHKNKEAHDKGIAESRRILKTEKAA